jgi:acetylornithine deacetylase/succinyl-diaminopimelate desuccinylase-like protein
VAAEIAAACSVAEEGWRPESGELKVIVTADEEAGAEHGAKWLCDQMADRVRTDLVVNEGGGNSFDFEGRRVYLVEVAEKGVFRFTMTTRGAAGHASMPRIGDNALAKMVPVIDALSGGRPVLEGSPEAEAFMGALGIETDGDVAAALGELERRDPRIAILVEPSLGVTFAPTMISASEKINVIPARARLGVDCRVLPGQGQEEVRGRLEELLGENGYELSFDEQVVGNRSPTESPLMDRIRDFVERTDPGAALAPALMPGFTDSRWFREAFPECVAYGFFPMRRMDMFEAIPLIHGVDERIPVEDLGLAARCYAELVQAVLG